MEHAADESKGCEPRERDAEHTRKEECQGTGDGSELVGSSPDQQGKGRTGV